MTTAVTGLVTFEQRPLPGCTVRISSGPFAATTVTDGEGLYRFDAVPPGSAEVSFSLDGFRPDQLQAEVGPGTNRVRDVELRFTTTTEIVTISEPPCGEESSPWQLPTCREYDLNSALIDTATRGDRSAANLLLARYETTESRYERNRIAGALLHHIDDDSTLWRSLESDAANAVRFRSEDSPELQEWCSQQGFDPGDYLGVAFDALSVASTDARSRPLLLKALDSGDASLVCVAVSGFASQRDETALPAIQTAMAGSEKVQDCAIYLAWFGTDAADQIAFQYLPEKDRDEYREERERPRDSAGTPAH